MVIVVPFAANQGHGTHTDGIKGNNGVGISGIIQKASMMIVPIFTDRGNAISGANVSNSRWGGSTGRTGDVLYTAIK